MPPTTEQLMGTKTLLEGPTGTGKTHVIGTLVDTGLECFYFDVGLAGMESLLGYWTERGLPIPPNLHWNKLVQPKADFATLMGAAEKINQYTLKVLSDLNDPDKTKYNGFINLLSTLNSFTDQRTGENFGAVDTWGTDRCLIIDNMSGINSIAMSLVTGGKPVKNQADWGIAQDQIEKLLRMLTDGCACHFVLTAHVEREVDPTFGGAKITISTLGKALAPKVPPMFSDVILTYREGKEFLWSTANTSADLKCRYLPLGDKLKPSFEPIIKKWNQRREAA